MTTAPAEQETPTMRQPTEQDKQMATDLRAIAKAFGERENLFLATRMTAEQDTDAGRLRVEWIVGEAGSLTVRVNDVLAFDLAEADRSIPAIVGVYRPGHWERLIAPWAGKARSRLEAIKAIRDREFAKSLRDNFAPLEG